MSPLMQTICSHLSSCCLSRYIDRAEQEANAMERDCLRATLAAALPHAYQDLLEHYDDLHLCRLTLETEAMFQAAFAAARELL